MLSRAAVMSSGLKTYDVAIDLHLVVFEYFQRLSAVKSDASLLRVFASYNR